MSTRHDLLNEPVSSLQQYDLVTLKPQTTVADAMRIIAGAPLACAIVINEAGQPLGTFTERQIVAALLREPTVIQAQVADHLAPVTQTIAAGAPISEAVAMIDEKDVGYLCVVDDQGRPQSLIGQRSIVDYIVDRYPRAVLTSRLGAHPVIAEREGA